jgi:hypothetical protein
MPLSTVKVPSLCDLGEHNLPEIDYKSRSVLEGSGSVLYRLVPQDYLKTIIRPVVITKPILL